MKAWPRGARWSVYVLVGILFAVACAFLSSWQFARGELREASNALIENNYGADPVPLNDLMSGTDDFDADDEWHPVVVTGEYIADEQLLARNRAEGGTSAYEVVVPLRLEDGRILAVDRGWVPPAYEGGAEAVPAPPAGDVTVVARLRGSEALPASGRGAPEGQLPMIHVPSIAAHTGENTITPVYAVMVSEDPAPAERPRRLAAPEVDPGPHLSYAVQWILFALMGFAFIGYMIRTEVLSARAEDEDDPDDLDDDAPRPKRRPRPRRRDRDADEEDAILDRM